MGTPKKHKKGKYCAGPDCDCDFGSKGKPKRIAGQGECGKCFSMNLDYQASEIRDNQIMYPYTCLKCKHTGEEWYDLVHVEQK